MIGRDYGILRKTLYGQYSIFSTKKTLSNFKQNIQFGAPGQPFKCDTVS